MKKKSAKKSDIIMQPVLMPAMPGMIGMEGLAPNVMWVPVKKTSIKKSVSKKPAAKKATSKNKKPSPKATSQNVSRSKK